MQLNIYSDIEVVLVTLIISYLEKEDVGKLQKVIDYLKS